LSQNKCKTVPCSLDIINEGIFKEGDVADTGNIVTVNNIMTKQRTQIPVQPETHRTRRSKIEHCDFVWFLQTFGRLTGGK